MKIKDYIFYRMYCIYKKSNEFARISAIAYLSFIDYLIILPFLFIGAAGTRLIGTPAVLCFCLPTAFLFTLNSIRYIKTKRLNNLIKKYYNNKYNRIVKNWMLYALIFVAIAWGLLGIVPISYLMSLMSS